MRTIYMDIETVPLPVEQREHSRPTASSVKLGNIVDPGKIAAKVNKAIAEFESGVNAAIDPLQASIALIGFAIDDGEVQFIHGYEREMLQKFWTVVGGKDGFAAAETEIVGHNIRFDAGMLVHRSWLVGVKPPLALVTDLIKYQPTHWRDTMTRWQLGDKMASWQPLNKLCKAFGIPVKESAVNGAKFYEWWAKDKPACLEYNKQDVEAVRELWKLIS